MKPLLTRQQSPGFLAISISSITCLTLLINASFKIVLLGGMIFSVNSIICPLIAGLYLLALRHCTFSEQRHVLNVSLMSLYVFCIGVYILVNLPAAESIHDNPVYQIIFEDIPKKFFAITIAFACSFYLPHILLYNKSNSLYFSPKQSLLLAIPSGLCFFIINFGLLFSADSLIHFRQIFIDSTMIATLISLLITIIYLTCLLAMPPPLPQTRPINSPFPIFHYLICFATVVMLICLACEYRIIAFFISNNSMLAASAVFFPLTIITSTLLGELCGYKVNMSLGLILIATQFIFVTLLMGLVALPSPNFFNLNPFYNYILLRRLPAASLTLLATFASNAILLHYLRHSKWSVQRPLRILIANLCANSLLCLIDYSLLFGGIYPCEQIINLVINVWQYKLLMTLLSLPFILWCCTYLEKNRLWCLNTVG